MQQLTTPRQLLAVRLRQMLGIELRLADEVLPRLAEEAHATNLQLGFERHLLETRQHIATVRDVLGDLGARIEPEESPGFDGLVAEHEQLVARCGGGPLLCDLAHAVAALAAEHVEIAAYESLVSLAESLGEEEIGIRLREVLEQEEFALEQVEAAIAKLLAEKVESEHL